MRLIVVSRLILVCMSAAAVSRCSLSSTPLPLVFEDRFRVEGLPPVDIEVHVQPEHRSEARRYLEAAAATLRMLGSWIAPYPASSLVLIDPVWHGNAEPQRDAVLEALQVPHRVPWWTTPTAMAPELATVRTICLKYWTSVVDTRALPSWFVDGVSEYAARRIVVELFAHDNTSPGYAMYEARNFGGFVPRFVRIRLLPESDGNPLTDYRARPRVNVTSGDDPNDRRSLSGKTVLTLDTLERWVGRPVFDAIMTEFVRQSRRGQPSISDFAQIASASSGQDLSWLFNQTLGGPGVFDYAVAAIDSEPADGSAYETRVTVERRGDGIFSGSTAPRVGPFDSGRGLALRVRFADGDEIVDHWDGRDVRRTFTYRSPFRALSAEIDPDRLLALDMHRTNNGRTLVPRTDVAARRWAARWMIWLENLVLGYAFFA